MELKLLHTFGSFTHFFWDLFLRRMTAIISKVLDESAVTTAIMLMIIAHLWFVPDNE